jgi:hypothetical protein
VTIDRPCPEHLGGPDEQRFDHRGVRHLHTFGRQRRHATVDDPTRDNVPEHGEVTLDVERQTVQRAPRSWCTTDDTHTDGRNLPWPFTLGVDPHTRERGITRCTGQPQIRQGGDDQLLQSVHMCGARRRLVGYRQDRVEDELAGPVIGDVAATVCLFDGGAH